MDSIDTFATLLLEESKRFLELAKEADQEEPTVANLHASMVLVFCALEAHINAICDEMALQKNLTAHEKSLLLEKDVQLENGRFKLKSGLKMYRIEDRIQFLFARFTSTPLNKEATWWANLKSALKTRNSLSHPKDATVLDVKDVSKSIEAIIECLDVIYQAIYGRGFPAATRGLHSKLTF